MDGLGLVDHPPFETSGTLSLRWHFHLQFRTDKIELLVPEVQPYVDGDLDFCTVEPPFGILGREPLEQNIEAYLDFNHEPFRTSNHEYISASAHTVARRQMFQRTSGGGATPREGRTCRASRVDI